MVGLEVPSWNCKIIQTLETMDFVTMQLTEHLQQMAGSERRYYRRHYMCLSKFNYNVRDLS